MEDLNKELKEKKKGEMTEKINQMNLEIKILESEIRIKNIKLKELDQVIYIY